MSKLAFDGVEINIDITKLQKFKKSDWERLALETQIPEWVFEWYTKKYFAVNQKYFSDGGNMIVKYPPHFIKRQEVEDVYGNLRIQEDFPKLKSFPINVSVVIPQSEGGDGIEHTWTYFERRVNEASGKGQPPIEKFKLADNREKMSITMNGMIISPSQINKAIFLEYLCPYKDKFYVIVDAVMTAKQKNELRRKVSKISNMVLNELSEDIIRTIAAGEYRISGADKKDISVLQEELLSKISPELQNPQTTVVAYTRFIDAVSNLEAVQRKKFVQLCFDYNAVLVTNIGGEKWLCFNQSNKDNPVVGERIVKLRVGGNQFDALLEHLNRNPYDEEALNKYMAYYLKKFYVKQEDTVVDNNQNDEPVINQEVTHLESQTTNDLPDDLSRYTLDDLKEIYIKENNRKPTGFEVKDRQALIRAILKKRAARS